MSTPNTMEAVLAEGKEAAAALGIPGTPRSQFDQTGINNMAAAFEKARAEITAPPGKPAEPVVPEAVVVDPRKPVAKEPADPVVPDPAPEAPVKTSKVRDEFKKLETLKADLEKRATIAEARIKEFESRKPEDSPEIVKLRQEHEEQSKRLQILDVTKHPKFVAYFDGKVAGVRAQAEQYFGAEAPKIMEVLEAPPSRARNQALAELLPDLDDMERQQLGVIALKSDEIKLERQTEIARAGTLAQQMKERQAADQAGYRKQLESKFDSALTESRKTYRLFQPKEGDEEWNNGIPVLEARAKQIFSGLNTPEEAAQAAVFAAMAPRQIEYIAAQDSYIQKLEAQIKSLQSATPTIPIHWKALANGKAKPVGFLETFAGVMDGSIPLPAKPR